MAVNPSYYQTGLVSVPVQQREHLFHLYSYQVVEGKPNSNQKIIVNPSQSNYFGVTVVNDWVIYDGIPPNGKLVARLQGIHVGADKSVQNWFLSSNLVFVDDRFNGSVLKVDGPFGPPDNNGASGQLAIVGGTGEFAYAQGIITYTNKSYVNGEVVKELRIRAVCPVFTNQIPVTPPINKVLPPTGGNGGDAVDVTPKPQHLESVTIRSGDVIDSISFSYIDEAGMKQTAGPWGGNGGLPVTINFKSNETVKKIMGTTGNFGGNVVVTSLKIVTNLDTYGTYGKGSGTQFAIPEKDSDSVVGFHGRAGLFVDAIGIYITASGN